jgi:hypothetical protein
MVVPCVLLGFAALAVVGLGTRPGAIPHPAGIVAAGSCADGSGGGVIGRLPLGGGMLVVQIVPDDSYGAAFLNAIRDRMQLAERPAAILSIDDLRRFESQIRYARMDRTGRFTCHALDPGRYLAIATTTRFDGVLQAARVAPFVAPGRGVATLAANRFRPLQKIQ